MASPVKALAQRLRAGLVSSFEPDNLYMTTTRLQQLLDDKTVGEILETIFPEMNELDRQDLKLKIRTYEYDDSGQTTNQSPLARIFAILVLIGEPERITHFVIISPGLSDKGLPFSTTGPEESRSVPIFWKTWPPSLVKEFLKTQRAFSSVFVSRSILKEPQPTSMSLIPTHPLARTTPIIESDMADYKGPLIFHPGHHDLSDDDTDEFAICTLFSMPSTQVLKDLQKSFKYLEEFTGTGSTEHIFSPLSYFKYLGHTRFITPFFEPYTAAPVFANPRSRENIIWFARQWEGIVSNINDLTAYVASRQRPYPFGCGDLWIKPNALRLVPSKDPKTLPVLKIDFVFCRLETDHTALMRLEPTCIADNAPPSERSKRRYIPPEFYWCGVGLFDDATRTSWSLGSLLLESITKMITGEELGAALERSGLPFTYCEKEAGTDRLILSPGIQLALEELRQHKNCTPFLRDILGLVKDHLLVVDFHDRMMVPEVLPKLRAMREKVEQSQKYALGTQSQFLNDGGAGNRTRRTSEKTFKDPRRIRSEITPRAPKLVRLCRRVASLQIPFPGRK